MWYKMTLFLLGLLNGYVLFAQVSEETNDHLMDSVTSAYLLKLYPDTSENVLGAGRHYKCLSFRLPVAVNDTIVAVNFGINNDHDPSYMLVLHKNKTHLKYMLLGRESLESDILSLQKFITSLNKPMKEQYQLEIWDLFIKCRLGVIGTPLYLH